MAELRYQEDAPLQRAEHIVKNGTDEDAGPVPCEDTVEAQCLSFRELNRLRMDSGDLSLSEDGEETATEGDIDNWIDETSREFRTIVTDMMQMVDEE